MNSITINTSGFGAPSTAWPRPRCAGASLLGAAVYPFAVSLMGAKHAQKRFTMTGTDINGWPLGPRQGTSG